MPGASIAENGFLRAVVIGNIKTQERNKNFEINIIPSGIVNNKETNDDLLKPAPPHIESIKANGFEDLEQKAIADRLAGANKLTYHFRTATINSTKPVAGANIVAKQKRVIVADEKQAASLSKTSLPINDKSNLKKAATVLTTKAPAKPARSIPVFHKGLLYVRKRKKKNGIEENEEDKEPFANDTAAPLVVKASCTPVEEIAKPSELIDDEGDDSEDGVSEECCGDEGGGGDGGDGGGDGGGEAGDGSDGSDGASDSDGADDGDEDDDSKDEDDEPGEFLDETEPCPTDNNSGDLDEFYLKYFDGFLGGHPDVSFETGTTPPPGYTYSSENGGVYVDSQGKQAGGVTYCAPVNGNIGPITIYIAPAAIKQGAAFVLAQMGHELIHALDIYNNPSMYLNNPTQFNANSEYAAYNYQAQIAASYFPSSAAEGASSFYQNAANSNGAGRNASWNTGLDMPAKPTQPCI